MTVNTPERLKFSNIRLEYSSNAKENLVRLPGYIVSILESTSISVQEFGVEINSKFYVGWDGYESENMINGDYVLEINPVLAYEFGFKSGEIIDIAIIHYNESLIANEVHIEPKSSDDWEIIENNAQFFQDEMLYQTRIIAINNPLVCYIDRTVAKFIITSIQPSHLLSGRITTNTMVVVTPKKNTLRRFDIQELNHKFYGVEVVKKSMYMESNELKFIIQLNPNEIQSKLCYVSVIFNALESTGSSSEDKSENMFCPSRKIAVEVHPNNDIPKEYVSLSIPIWNSLNMEMCNGQKILLEFLDDNKLSERPNIIFSLISSSKTVKSTLNNEDDKNTFLNEKLKTLIDNFEGSILTNGIYLPTYNVCINLRTDKGKIIEYYKWDQGEKVVWKLSHTITKMHPWEKKEPLIKPNPIIGVNKLINEIINSLLHPVNHSSCFLLQGLSGMGKTLLIQNISYKLIVDHKFYVKIIDCNTLEENSNLDNMSQFIKKCCATAYWYTPSLIILDNCDILFPNIRAEDNSYLTNSFNNDSTKLTHLLINEINHIANNIGSSAKFLISIKGRDLINPLFFQKHFIKTVWTLKPPNMNQRSEIIQSFFNKKGISIAPDLSMDDISFETEGYSPRNLSILVDKIFHQIIFRQVDTTDFIIDSQIFREAVGDFTPSSFYGIKLKRGTGITWENIGALDSAKKLLLETLEWPKKYSPIFSKCPLRLRSGILLYGYPGCGKTMLASAVAQQCGLNFISVKGPEILNKYIGASEQSIRELFEKATIAKPCIIFFDEFESIAPKRGYDSTGVTDRVVNQMLVQMDGAESLEGVYVLAATSRPDLIDPALLRPGRLDKSILCNLPDYKERLEILKAISRAGKMDIDSMCDLRKIAENTDGFSGADLQGLCYNAYLKAVHRNLENKLNLEEQEDMSEDNLEYQVLSTDKVNVIEYMEKIQKLAGSEIDIPQRKTLLTSNQLVITMKDMLISCRETRPSISSVELQKLRTIYNNFVTERDGNLPNGEASQEVGGRITLM